MVRRGGPWGRTRLGGTVPKYPTTETSPKACPGEGAGGFVVMLSSHAVVRRESEEESKVKAARGLQCGVLGRPDSEKTVKRPIRVSHRLSACRAVCQPVRSGEQGGAVCSPWTLPGCPSGALRASCQRTPPGRGPGSLPPQLWLRQVLAQAAGVLSWLPA